MFYSSVNRCTINNNIVIFFLIYTIFSVSSIVTYFLLHYTTKLI